MFLGIGHRFENWKSKTDADPKQRVGRVLASKGYKAKAKPKPKPGFSDVLFVILLDNSRRDAFFEKHHMFMLETKAELL